MDACQKRITCNWHNGCENVAVRLDAESGGGLLRSAGGRSRGGSAQQGRGPEVLPDSGAGAGVAHLFRLRFR